MDKRDKIITLCLLAVTVTTAFFAWPQSPAPHTSAENTNSGAKLMVATNYFDHIQIQAKAAYVYDLTTGKELFVKNASTPLPLASLTKIMTAVTADELAPQSTKVTVDDRSLSVEGDSGLYANEQWSLNKLLQYTLVASSNDGAAAVAESLGALTNPDPSVDSKASFVAAMNRKAQSLGLLDMHFNNPSGLDVSPTEAGAYGSAKDVAHLLAYAMKHQSSIIEPTRYESYTVVSDSNLRHTAENTDVLTNKIPSLIAGKTGFTDLAGGNLAVIFDAGMQHPIAVVVLGSTYDGRFLDVETLVQAAIHTVTGQ